MTDNAEKPKKKGTGSWTSKAPEDAVKKGGALRPKMLAPELIEDIEHHIAAGMKKANGEVKGHLELASRSLTALREAVRILTKG